MCVFPLLYSYFVWVFVLTRTTDEGTTERLSRLWMSPEEFTKYEIEGLQRGDFNVITPSMQDVWNKVEKDRVEMCGKVAFVKK